MMLQFLLYFFCAFLVLIFASKCPQESSVEWKNKCYFFINKLDVFCDAEINCMNNFGGHLSSIEEGFTNAFVAQIGEPRINVSLDIWIGANNLINMDVWQWTDGSFFNYSNWQYLNISSVSQRCGALSLTNGIWNVEDCYKLKSYVCATNAAGAITPTPLPLPTTLPPFPWTTTTASPTGKPTTSGIETSTASSLPTSQTSTTATNPPTSETPTSSIPTSEHPTTQQTTEPTTESSSTIPPITVTTPPTSESTPATSILTSENPTTSGTTINTFSPTSESITPNSPTPEISTTPSTERTSSNPTSPTMPTTLEPTTESTTPEITICPAGWKHYDSFCYSLTSEKENWYDAKAECFTKGGILASIHSQNELNFIYELMETNEKWIGLYITPTHDSFAWIDNTTYDFHSLNAPSVDDEKCVYALHKFYNDLDCDEDKLFGVCKKHSAYLPTTIEPEPSDTPTTPEITTSISYPPMYCPSNWSLYEPSSSCYSQTPNKMTWLASEQYCVEQGGHLASIHSRAELNFTDELITGFTWIGFNFVDETWKWTDDSIVDYTRWYQTYPNKNFSKCVNSLYAFINDYDCDKKLIYGLCKKPSIQISTATFLPTTHEIQTSTIPTTLEPSTSESTIQTQTTTYLSTTIELEPSTVQTTNTPTPIYSPTTPLERTTILPQKKSCESDWIQYDVTSFCYKRTPNKMSWFHAEQYCNAIGGHLASIHTPDELDIIDIFENYWKWIGLHQNEENLEWEWTDGSVTDFMPWWTGNATLKNDYECAVAFEGHFLKVVDCLSGDSIYGICKKAPTPETNHIPDFISFD